MKKEELAKVVEAYDKFQYDYLKEYPTHINVTKKETKVYQKVLINGSNNKQYTFKK